MILEKTILVEKESKNDRKLSLGGYTRDNNFLFDASKFFKEVETLRLSEKEKVSKKQKKKMKKKQK